MCRGTGSGGEQPSRILREQHRRVGLLEEHGAVAVLPAELRVAPRQERSANRHQEDADCSS
jgi:hypothetical protein